MSSSTSTFGMVALALMAMMPSSFAAGPPPVPLGKAGNFAILAKTGISTVPLSTIIGNIAVSPAPGTYMTGFNMIMAVDTTHATSPQVVGNMMAASMTSPTPSTLTTSIGDMLIAYNNAAGRVNPNFSELGAGNIGGLTLHPGLYKWSSSVIIPTAVTLAGSNHPGNDTWIFQIAGTLEQADNVKMIMANGAVSQNVFWQVAGATTLGAGSHFEGAILAATGVTLDTGATMNGRILAGTRVDLQMATVNSLPARRVKGGNRPVRRVLRWERQ